MEINQNKSDRKAQSIAIRYLIISYSTGFIASFATHVYTLLTFSTYRIQFYINDLS